MDITLNIPKLYGDMNAKVLFTVTFVDTDDTEDTSVQMFLANDDEHLEELVKEYCDVDENTEDSFNDDWGFKILYNEVGRKI